MRPEFSLRCAPLQAPPAVLVTMADDDGAEETERNRGPCGHPSCPTPDYNGGQWFKIKNLKVAEVRDGAICVCKKPDCRRYFGMMPEKQQPGRKRQAVLPLPAAADGVQDHWELKRIKSILGFRCAPACLPACLGANPAPCMAGT